MWYLIIYHKNITGYYRFSFWRRANARNVRLGYPYWQYTNLFIFRFVSLCTLPTQHTTFITGLLTGLFMHVETDEQIDLNNVVGIITINQQPCSFIMSGNYVVREWWNNKIEQWCYNHGLGCCIKSGFACSNIREQPLSIRQAVLIQYVETWLNNTVQYFTNPVLIMLTVLLQATAGLLSQQPYSSLSTGKIKLCVFMCVV